MELTPSDPIAGLDVERLDMLRDLDAGSTAYLDRAIGNFLAHSGPATERIREAAGSGDVDAMRQAAHKLAGSALNLGVQEVGAAARELELLGDAGTTAGSDTLLTTLDRAVERGRGLLRRYHASYSSQA